MPLHFADQALARQLEHTEIAVSTALLAARQRTFPPVAATWVDVAGARGFFDGVDSPLTQSFGLGLSGPVTPAQLAQLEQFFLRQHAPVHHEVSPLADAELLALLPARGYQPVEYTSVLYQPLTVPDKPLPVAASPHPIQVRLCGPADAHGWGATSAMGWQTPGSD